ncbi:hypothetical protein EIP86_010088 [Pleurotus ostreatoroseus]|nr:hypothetical protein EIP86_010088 [Pleurotus ostreatoroseus]
MYEKPDVPFSHHVFSRDEVSWAFIGGFNQSGANWRVYQGIHNLNAWIVDFDGGSIGSIVTQAYLNATGPQEQLSYYTVPASSFPNGESDVVNAVLNEECWLAVVISAGATDRLNAAIANGSDANFNNSAAVTIYAEEARNENS